MFCGWNGSCYICTNCNVLHYNPWELVKMTCWTLGRQCNRNTLRSGSSRSSVALIDQCCFRECSSVSCSLSCWNKWRIQNPNTVVYGNDGIIVMDSVRVGAFLHMQYYISRELRDNKNLVYFLYLSPSMTPLYSRPFFASLDKSSPSAENGQHLPVLLQGLADR